MPRNGSGTFQLVAGNPVVTGTTISSTVQNNTMSDVAAALTMSISTDGQTPMAANLPMGGNKLTGLAAGTGLGESVRWEQLFEGGVEQSLPSAATTDIGQLNTEFVNVTGTTTITSFGINYRGVRFLRFSGAVKITNSATLVTNTGTDIITVAGQILIAIPKATTGTADGWEVVLGNVLTDQWKQSGQTPTFISTTSYSMPGDQTADFHVNRRLQFLTTAGAKYGSIATSAYTTLTTVTMKMDGADVLDSGLNVVNLSILRADHTAVPYVPVIAPYVYIRQELATGTDGGTFTSAAFRTRSLNVKASDVLSLATLSSNQITLVAGTYQVSARCPAVTVDQHKCRLRNVTAGSTLIVGSNTVASATSSGSSDSFLNGIFTIAASQLLELQHVCVTTKTGNGFGASTGAGEVEVYAEIEFLRIA